MPVLALLLLGAKQSVRRLSDSMPVRSLTEPTPFSLVLFP
jgi:hypothetical protein